MLPRKWIEAYLFYLLRHRLFVSVVVALTTVLLAGCWVRWGGVYPNFLDLYPPGHPYIKLYNQYRSMFGTANTLLFVVEVKDGTIFDDPATVQKVDRITLALLHDIPGVNGEQVLSITHPKIKTTLTSGSGIKVVPLMYPRVPESKEDLDFLKLKVYTTEGVKGPFVSEDDKATLIMAGFWEEYFDLPTMWKKVREIVEQESDENTTIYATGFPILYAYFLETLPQMVGVLAASIVALLAILWVYFRSWQGVVVPAFSGALSAVWGLGFGAIFGLKLDPLVLVIPLLISARALSHSVQSMERYHEEYFELRDKDQAIVKSYTEIYAPAMVSILADGLAILTLYVARIPIIQKLAILCSFWIISIIISVVTLHPIILSLTPPPDERVSGEGALERFMAWMMVAGTAWLLWLYDYVPGWPVVGLLGATCAGLACDLPRMARPVAGFTAGGLVAVAAAALWFGVSAGVVLGTGVFVVLVALLRRGISPVVMPVYAGLGTVVGRLTTRLGSGSARSYAAVERFLIWLALGWRRQAMAGSLVVLLGIGLYFAHYLKVGDTTPGAALLYADHPYNVAFGKVNQRFLGASQLVIIAEGKAYCTVDGEPCEGEDCRVCLPEEAGSCGSEECVQRDNAIKSAATLSDLDLFARYMEERPEVGGTVTATTLLKRIFRTFHEGDPKWEILPTNDDHVGQLFFLLTSGTRRGELDRFFDMNYRNATIQVFYKDYTHETIARSIARAKEYIAEHASDHDRVRYRLAGGLIGILAAVNEEVQWSYRVNLFLILAVVFALSYLTYVSVTGALIVMLPSLVAQPLSEAVMYLFGIDMNINSLPVAAVGIGIGIDYGYYVLSRIVEELAAGEDFDPAIRRMFETTGKTVLFTGVSLTVSIIFWVFFPMKFQADMALLLILLLGFHLLGALVFIPPMVSLLRPRFAIRYAERQRARVEEAAAAAVAARASAGGR